MDHTIEVSTTENPQSSTVEPALQPAAPKLLTKPGPSRKRPFPNKRTPTKPTQAKRAKASFDKSEVAKHVSFTTPIFTAYEIDTSHRGLFRLCEIFYQILINRDQRIANMITANHFVYVTLLSAIYRSLLVCSKSTTYMVRNISYLKESVQDLLLPDVLCQYVETLGYYKLASEVTVIPFIRSYAYMRGDVVTFTDPAAVLLAMGEPVPDIDWAIDDRIILQYKQAISRVLKNAVQLRCVNNSELEAKPEFISVYRMDNGRVIPQAFERMCRAQATLGAVYQFRNSDRIADWHGLIPAVVHEATAVSVDSYLTDYILNHLSTSGKQ